MGNRAHGSRAPREYWRSTVPDVVPSHFPRLFRTLGCFTVSKQMLDRTDTLQIGSRAPEFALEAANREGVITLSGFLQRGNLILEFLRGTW
jgi:hypothetical protein